MKDIDLAVQDARTPKKRFLHNRDAPQSFGQPSTAGDRIKVLRVEYIIDFANITKKTENELTKLNLKIYI